ncbi:hypothetical protein [Arthrobacter woluwensis]|uniref:hypothetical protein n=1 Tax=Arthrobacter woluwensis TaxID=156980 RepID=UPI00381E7931
MSNRDAFFTFFSGRRGADTSGAAPQADASTEARVDQLRGQLIAAFGTNRRGGVDTKAAAKALGVSQRSVNYWLAGKYKPSEQHQKTVQRRSRQAATTKRGRQRLAQDARNRLAKLPKGKTPQIFVVGVQGPNNAQADYLRHRVTNIFQNLTPTDVDDFIKAWEEHGEQGAKDWLTNAYGSRYLEDWGFESIDKISFGDPRGFDEDEH